MNKITLLILGIMLFSSCEKDEEIDTTDITENTTTQTVCSPTASNLTETAISSYTAPNDTIYTTSGTYEVVIANTAGCDSTITINLTINQLAVIGEYRDGGVVFWEDGKGGGLVCAISDQSSAVQWNSSGADKWISTQEQAIGTGQANTTTIIAEQGVGTDYAAAIATAYEGGEFTDWFLPSKNELIEMAQNRDVINTSAISNGGTALSNQYWSSSQYDTKHAYYTFLPPSPNAPVTQARDKTLTSAVRAIRAF